MNKAIVKNEHRELFAAGKLEEIPQDALAILQEQKKQTQKSNGNNESEVLVRKSKHSSDNAA